MAARRRIRASVKKPCRSRVTALTDADPIEPTSRVWQVLRDIDQLLKGIDDALDDRVA